MRIGFVGTGAIAEAMVEGLCGAAGHEGPVTLSERSKFRSDRLVCKYGNVTSSPDNQRISDASEIVIVSVLPDQVEEVLAALRFRPDHVVLSLAAGVSLTRLEPLVAPAGRVHRSIPLPPIDRGIGPLPLFPPDETLESLLGTVATVIPVDRERQFDALSAGSALMAAFFALNARAAKWLEDQGVPETEAAAYATSLYHSLAVMACAEDARGLRALPQDCLTAGGINEQVLTELQDQGWTEAAARALDGIMARFARSG